MLKRKVLALAVMPAELLALLDPVLEALGIDRLTAPDCEGARSILRTDAPVDMVFTAVTLPDGNWCCLLGDLVQRGVEAEVFVCVPECPHNLSDEVRQRGARCLRLNLDNQQTVAKVIQAALEKSYAYQR